MTETFSIIPAGTRPLWVLLPVLGLLLALLVGALVVLGGAWHGSQRARFEVSPSGLRLRGDVYGRLIPAADLKGGAARIVDLRSAPEYRATKRLFGTGLPGYQAGWFRLGNGEKALLFVTDWSNVVYLPTRGGYSVLLSPTQPRSLLQALRALAPAT